MERHTIKIAITTEKGGCGKTTTAVSLAAILAEREFKVLLIDGDYQSYSTHNLGLYHEEQLTIHEVMLGAEAKEAIVKTDFSFDLLPSAMKFRSMEESLTVQKMKGQSYEYTLKNALLTLDGSYDYIICDCPPNGDKVQQNIEAYADYLILPTIPDDNAIHTFLVKANALAKVKQSINPRLSVLGALIVAENAWHKNDRLYGSAIRSQDVFPCFKTSIRFTTDFRKALNAHEPINVYDSRCAGNKDYQSLVEEVIELTQEGK